MNTSFGRWLLGLRDLPTDTGQLQIAWERPIPGWVWFLAITVCIAIAIWSYSRLDAGRRARGFLATARAGILALLLVAVAGPMIELPRELVEPDWVAVLALGEGEALLVEQYRHGVGRASLELPAGVIDEGESAAEAAARELREETGYVASRIEPLGVVSPEPARNTAMGHFYVETGCRQVGEQRLDRSEHIAVRPLAVADLLNAVDDGRIVHGSHVAAILLAERRGLLG